jgi:hypothetical protein
MIKFRLAILALFLGCFLLTAQSARADDSTDVPLFKFEALDFSTNVPADQRWTVEMLGTGVGDVTNRRVALYGLTGGVGYSFFNNMALMLDVTGYGFSEGHSNGAAVGVALGLRHQMFSVGKTQVFLEVYGGEIEASNNIPMGGTHLNDNLQFGFGIDRPITGNLYWEGGARYYHISNARSEGPDRNPSFNGVQGFLGLMWKL